MVVTCLMLQSHSMTTCVAASCPVTVLAFSARECTDLGCDEAYLCGGEFRMAHTAILAWVTF